MLICPSCGKELAGEFPFCPYCTAPLTEQPALSVHEERKVVTVLFCDLVGFTAASDEADPEDVRARIRPYFARLRQEIERYSGTVEKFIGDAVMAVFGAPVAHEDDAERAVRAGLRTLEAIEELNVANPMLSLQVRIGINTGEAVVALGGHLEAGEGLVTGDVVNTASRLQGVAPVNGIAVSEQTYRATERIFDYEELEPVQVKGKAKPLALYRPLAARARFGSDVTRTHATPLVGRELEKPLLIGTFERSAQQRSCQLVTIVGEPGVGKSRLCTEFFAYLDDRPGLTRWRQGRCLPYGEGIAFCERRGITEFVLGIAGMSATFLADLGQSEHALAEAEPLAERLAAAGDILFTEVRSLQLRLLAERGAHEHAPAADALVAAARESVEPQVSAVAFAAGARLLLAQGRPQQANALLVELEQVVGTRSDPYYAFFLPELIRTAHALGQRELSARLVDGVEPVTPLFENALSACRAQSAEAAGEHAEAAALYAEAAKRWVEFGSVPERAYALLGQGRCLTVLGEPVAQAPLREARRLFASMGYRPALAETEALLARGEAAAV